MTDPVDTDALRAQRWHDVDELVEWATAAADEVDRLRDRAVDDARNRERLRVDFNARAAEASRLRSVIESAPHGRACRWLYATSQSCTCWKADAL